jgi:hypothetical protein
MEACELNCQYQTVCVCGVDLAGVEYGPVVGFSEYHMHAYVLLNVGKFLRSSE